MWEVSLVFLNSNNSSYFVWFSFFFFSS